MAFGQVHHVDVVPHAGAVGGGIVVAEHVEMGPLAQSYLGDEGHKVVGGAVGRLPQQGAGMGSHRVEIAQQHHGKTGIGRRRVQQYLLDHQLGAAVGVGAAAHGHIFVHRH